MRTTETAQSGHDAAPQSVEMQAAYPQDWLALGQPQGEVSWEKQQVILVAKAQGTLRQVGGLNEETRIIFLGDNNCTLVPQASEVGLNVTYHSISQDGAVLPGSKELFDAQASGQPDPFSCVVVAHVSGEKRNDLIIA